MQVLVLLHAAGMQIIGTVLILIIQGVHLEVVNLVVGEILVDFETLHPLMLEEELVAEHQVEVLRGLDLVQALSEVRASVGIIPMCAQEKEIGFALILYVAT